MVTSSKRGAGGPAEGGEGERRPKEKDNSMEEDKTWAGAAGGSGGGTRKGVRFQGVGGQDKEEDPFCNGRLVVVTAMLGKNALPIPGVVAAIQYTGKALSLAMRKKKVRLGDLKDEDKDPVQLSKLHDDMGISDLSRVMRLAQDKKHLMLSPLPEKETVIFTVDFCTQFEVAGEELYNAGADCTNKSKGK